MLNLKLAQSNRRLRAVRLGITVGLAMLFLVVLLCGLRGVTPVRADSPLLSASDDVTILASEPYTVGAVLALTGVASSIGVPQSNAIEMLEDQINRQGGINGHPLSVIISDTQSNSTIARQMVSSLITDHNVLAIIGPSISPIAMNVLDVVDGAEVPLIALSSYSDIVEPVSARYWVFKTAPSIELAVARQLDYLQCHGLDQVAFMYVDSDYGRRARNIWAAQAPTAGVTTVIIETYNPGDTDFTTQLTNIAGSQAEALICWSYPSEAATITVQSRNLGLGIPILITDDACRQEFIDVAGDTANGVIAPCGRIGVADDLPDSDPQKVVILQYVADYTATYGTEANSSGGYAWDATQLISNALGTAGADRAGIRDAIESTTGSAGISGVFNFSAQDHNGLTKDALVIAEVVDEKWRLGAICETYLPLILKNFGP